MHYQPTTNWHHLLFMIHENNVLHDNNNRDQSELLCIHTCPLNSSISVALSRYHLVKSSLDTGELCVIEFKVQDIFVNEDVRWYGIIILIPTQDIVSSRDFLHK